MKCDQEALATQNSYKWNRLIFMKYLCKLPKTLLGGMAILLATELGLRGIGLNRPILYQADPYTGYRIQPNQKLFRLGKHINYNQYSQRSEPIAAQKPKNTLRILMLGDSVLNGGNPTDQTQTISEVLEELLSARDPSINGSVEVLNASAGSWGIGNQLGYLKEFGTFQSDIIILQIGTHDLSQPTSTADAVGKFAHPDKIPLLAIQELWSHYLWPRLVFLLPYSIQSKTSHLANEIPSAQDAQLQFQANMIYLGKIADYVLARKIPLFVVFTNNREDLLPSPTMPLQKPVFLETLKVLQLPVIDVHSEWSALPSATIEGYFRDIVHLSESGNQATAKFIFQELCDYQTAEHSSLLPVREQQNPCL
jgi:lysophospholipase L1-like esterase